MELDKGTLRLRIGKNMLREVILFLYLTLPILNAFFQEVLGYYSSS